MQDDNIADQHVQLLITPGSITLQPLARPVFVGGMEVTAESVELAPYQTVKLGNVEFLVADSRVAAPPLTNKTAHLASTQKRSRAGQSSAASASDSGQQRQQTASRCAKVSAKQKWGGKTWLAIGLGLLLLANLLYWAPQFNHFLQNSGNAGFWGAAGRSLDAGTG